VERVPHGWKHLAREGFGLDFSYPAITPRGQVVERDEEPFIGQYARVHLSSPDRQELYLEVVRFYDLAPQDEYRHHRPHLEERFGADAITELTPTKLGERPAWTYTFRWDEGDRVVERSALLLQAGSDTYRLIYDPRSELTALVISTLRIPE
jgi:hypothetical protein